MADDGGPRIRRRRRYGAAAIVGALLVAVGLGFFAGRLVQSPEQARAEQAAPPASLITADVARARLTTTVIFRADVSAGRTFTVAPSAVGVVTSVDVRRGARVASGTKVLSVNDRPVFVLAGAVPMYRDLRRGDHGGDVERLQESLNSAGHPTTDQLGVFGPSTEDALVALYAQVGLQPPTGLAVPSTEAAGSRPDGGSRPAQEDPSFVASQNELLFVRQLPSTVAALKVTEGISSEQASIMLRSSAPTLRANVNPLDARLLRVGQVVTASSGDGGVTVKGRIRTIGRPTTDEREGRVVPVVIVPRHDLRPSLVGGEMRVTASVAETKSTLLVPTSALETDASGHVFVRKVSGDRIKEVAVVVLGESNGRASIDARANELSEGDKVAVGVR